MDAPEPLPGAQGVLIAAAEWFDSIRDVAPGVWAAVAGDRFYLQPHYLATLEAIAPRQVSFRYCVVRSGGRPVAVAALQDLALTGDSIGRRVGGGSALQRLLRAAAGRLALPVRLCGNTFASSEHGFALAPDAEPATAAAALVDALTRRAEEAGGGFDSWVIPDADRSPGTAAVRRTLGDAGYVAFETDPTMVIVLHPATASVDDYVAGMTGKYRSRYRRIRAKGASLERVTMDADALQAQAGRTSELLDAVADRSSLRGSDFPRGYFVEMARGLGDAFAMTGYLLDGRLVGFGSTVATPGLLVGHYVGLGYECNTSHALYQNILWDYVARGIELGLPEVSLGRTASEIKSTLGAQQRPVQVYLRWQDRDRTQLIAPFFRLVRPPAWIPRNPFPERASSR